MTQCSLHQLTQGLGRQGQWISEKKAIKTLIRLVVKLKDIKLFKKKEWWFVSYFVFFTGGLSSNQCRLD